MSRPFGLMVFVIVGALWSHGAQTDVSKGVDLANKGSYEEAWVYLKDMNDSAQGRADALEARAVTAANLGFSEAATRSAEALVRNEHANANQLLEVGESLGRERLFTPAEECFTTARNLDPDSFRAWMDLAASFHAQGRFEEAVATARRSTEIQPSAFAAHYLLGSALISSGKTLDGILALRNAQKLRPNDLGLLTLLGIEYIKERYYGEAVAVLQSATKEDPANERLFLLLISASQDHSSAAAAKDVALNALQALPNSARIYAQLGVQEDALGDLESAKRHYRKSIELDATLAESHYLLGDVLYREANNYQDAIVLFRHAIALAPDYTDAYLRMGSALIALGKYQEAEDALERGSRIAPDDSRFYARLATCYRKEGKQEKLLEALQMFDRLHRNDVGGEVPQERPFPQL